MNLLCKIGLHDWIFGYRYNWIVAKECRRCEKRVYCHDDAPKDNIAFYDHKSGRR